MTTANCETKDIIITNRLNENSMNRTMENIPRPTHKQYQVPEDYNPANYPVVKLRNNQDRSSETQRKRRSKNRLSNRRSTGYVSKDVVDEALNIGPAGKFVAASEN